MSRTIPEINHLAVISSTTPSFGPERGGREEEFQSALDRYLIGYAGYQRQRLDTFSRHQIGGAFLRLLKVAWPTKARRLAGTPDD